MKPTKLNLLSLEKRDLPATFGIPWQDGSQVTLSFVPDGTLVGTEPSTLYAMLGTNTQAWQTEILRAFQTWAVQANVNIGLVSDDGSPLTAGGSVQGNRGFGDIRIAGVPLAQDVYAITAPPDMYSSWSGTILINTNKFLSIGGKKNAADLYTVMLQEAGHALGIGNSTSTSSVMYEFYNGVRSSLSAEDINSIQSLYGTRSADPYDLAANNGSRTTATALPNSGAEADITTTADVDWYRFTASRSSMQVRLDIAGRSLLNAIVRVTDANGRVIASGQSSSLFNNSVTLNLSNLSSGATYFVSVSAARSDVFGVGSYQLRVGTASMLSLQDQISNFLTNSVMPEFSSNETIATATHLSNPERVLSNSTDVIFSASYNSPLDVDFYRIESPALGSASQQSLIVSIWGLNGATIDPTLQVFDSNGRALEHTVIQASLTNAVIQVTNITPNTRYFIRTNSASGLIGNYRMAVNFINTEIPAPNLNVNQTLSGLLSKSTTTISISQSSYIHLTLGAMNAPDLTGLVVVTIYNSSNQVVGVLSTGPNRYQSLDIFLRAGTYRFEVTTTAFSSVDFSLAMYITTDPVGIAPTSTSTSPSSSNSSNSSNTNSNSPNKSDWWGSPSYTSSTTTTTQPAY